MFVNNKLSVSYGQRKQAVFTIIDEVFAGAGGTNTINRITVAVTQTDTAGNTVYSKIYSPVIGLGNADVQLTALNLAYMGQQLTQSNMTYCSVTLVE